MRARWLGSLAAFAAVLWLGASLAGADELPSREIVEQQRARQTKSRSGEPPAPAQRTSCATGGSAGPLVAAVLALGAACAGALALRKRKEVDVASNAHPARKD